MGREKQKNWSPEDIALAVSERVELYNNQEIDRARTVAINVLREIQKGHFRITEDGYLIVRSPFSYRNYHSLYVAGRKPFNIELHEHGFDCLDSFDNIFGKVYKLRQLAS